MKAKSITRSVSVFLAVLLIASFLSVAVSAAAPVITLQIDLSDYNGEVAGGIQYYFNSKATEVTTFPIEAGKVNTFQIKRVFQILNSSIELKSFSPTSYKDWTIGVNQGTPNILDQQDKLAIGDSTYQFLTLQQNKITLIGEDRQSTSIGNHWSSVFGDGTVITIKPGATVSYTATATSDDLTKGSASATDLGGSKYELSADALDGYSFDYWLRKDDPTETKIWDNPYTVKLTDGNAEFTAYFRNRYSVTVEANQAAYGETKATYKKATNQKDVWELSAKPLPGYAFINWTQNSEEVSTDAICTVYVDENATYTANYGLAKMNLTDGAYLEANIGVQNDLPVYKSGSGTAPYVGSRACLWIPFELTSDVAEPKIDVEVYSGETQLAVQTDGATGIKVAGKTYMMPVTIERVPAGLKEVRVVATLRTTAVRLASVEKVYSVSIQESGSAQNDTLTYITTPAYNQGSKGSAMDSGPEVSGVYAQENQITHELETYFYGKNGIYTWCADGTLDTVALSEGLPTTDALDGFSGVVAAGPGKDGSVLIAVEVPAQEIEKVTLPGYDTSSWNDKTLGSHFLYRWDGETWSQVENSCFSAYTEVSGTPDFTRPVSPSNDRSITSTNVVILSEDDVWQNKYHWNGTSWEEHTYKFNSFARVSATEAWAGATDGFYHYTNKQWVKVSDGYANILSMTKDQLLLKKDMGSFLYADIVRYDVETGTETLIQKLLNSNVLGYGLDHNNDLYCFTIGRYGVGTGAFADADMYKFVDGQWQYQYVSSFFDDGDTNTAITSSRKIRPALVKAASSPSAGVTFFYGSGGAGTLYISADETTISFDANGGELTGNSKLTGRICSLIDEDSVPTAQKAGQSFQGWYYDKDDATVRWDPTSRFPAKSVTLYAVWGEGSLDAYRASALENLKRAYEKYSRSDYTDENWNLLESAYNQGITDINNAPLADGQYPENNVIDALNKALAAMAAVEKKPTSDTIDVIVSIDANTLTLGYYVEPTVVSVPKYTTAASLLDQVIIATVKEKYGDACKAEGKWTDVKGEIPELYAYLHTGTLESSFYLAQIYWPDQDGAEIPQYIRDAAAKDNKAIDLSSSSGNYLGEFDYCSMSGWMYSVADRYDGNPVFPGVGLADWILSDGEVVRLQFTVWGYGADLNADNTQWGGKNIAGKTVEVEEDGQIVTKTIPAGDKTELTAAIADLRKTYGDTLKLTNEKYNEAYQVLLDPVATQDELDAAVKTLKELAAELEQKANEEAAKAVIDKINALGDPDQVMLEQENDVKAAREAYDALTDAQQEIVGSEILAKLEKAEAQIAELKQKKADEDAAQAVIDMIKALGDPDQVTLEQENDVKAARAAYDALTPAQQELVGSANLAKLEKAEARIEDLKKPEPITPVIPVTPSKPKDDKPTTGSSFTDVPAGSWYAEAVNYVSEKGLMNGTGTGTFSPNSTTTRGMIVTILARVEGVNTSGTPWYAAGQKWAMDNGISDGTNMVGEVTREQLAAILYRYAKQKGYDVSKSAALTAFSDADKVSGYAAEAMQWAVAEGLLQGSNGKLNPQGSATRAQVATILMRFMEKIAK